MTPSTPTHWASLSERGSDLGLRILILLYRVSGRRVAMALLHVIVAFFFLTGAKARAASRLYLRRAHAAGLLARPPDWRSSYRHFYHFARAGLDKFAAWTGDISLHAITGKDDPALRAALDAPAGAVIFTAHIGNPELSRALATLHGHRNILVLMHTAHARRFNRMIAQASPEAGIRIIEVTELGIETAGILQDAIDRGDWVVIAADRIPVTANGRVVQAKFLGHSAPFPQGPYILAGLLGCPVYTLFCLRTAIGHHISFEKFADRITLPRRHRAEAAGALAGDFAQRLEAVLRNDPLQWYNFYDFWAMPGSEAP
jgi:predicted LPLAT superfamily acyltransferase